MICFIFLGCKTSKNNLQTSPIHDVYFKKINSQSLMTQIDIVNNKEQAINIAIIYLNIIEEELGPDFNTLDKFEVNLINDNQIWSLMLDKVTRFSNTTNEKVLMRYYIFISKKDGGLILFISENPHFYGDTEREINYFTKKK